MKKTSALIVSFLFMFSAFSQEEDWGFNSGSDTEWNNANWWNNTKGQSETTPPGENVNVTLNNNASPLVSLGQNVHINSLQVWTAGGITMKTFTGDKPDKDSYKAPTLTINKDLTSNSGNLIIGSNGSTRGFQSINIGGDLNYLSGSDNKLSYNPFAEYGESNLSLSVGGSLNISEGVRLNINAAGNSNTVKSGDSVNAYVRLGGLSSVGGNAYLSNNDADAASTTIIFASDGKSAFKGGDFSGCITSWYQDSGVTSDMSIIMNAGEGSAKQFLRLFKSDAGGDQNFDNFTLETRSGHIGVYNTGTSKFDKVTLNGGTLEVAYISAGTHDPSQEEMGSIYADKLEINAASQIIFDVSGGASSMYENDVMHVGEVSGDGQLTLVVELDANYFTDGQSLNESFNLFSITDANNYDWASALVKVMYNGSEVSGLSALARYDGSGTGGGVWVDLVGVVPEPAAVAAILGAAALAFAVWRKRK